MTIDDNENVVLIPEDAYICFLYPCIRCHMRCNCVPSTFCKRCRYDLVAAHGDFERIFAEHDRHVARRMPPIVLDELPRLPPSTFVQVTKQVPSLYTGDEVWPFYAGGLHQPSP